MAAAHSNNPLHISPSHRCTVALIVLDVAVGSDVLGFAHVLEHCTSACSVFLPLNGAIAVQTAASGKDFGVTFKVTRSAGTGAGTISGSLFFFMVVQR
jgi:hypothetical protein